MSILGNRVLRKEDPALLTGGASYVDDLRVAGAAYATYVRSTFAHARLRSIDADGARCAPGVLAVFTAADLDLPGSPPASAFADPAMARRWLAEGAVRFVGEPIAVIVSETRPQGVDAAELVVVDYDPLPAVVDAEAALAGDTLLFPEVGTNVAFTLRPGDDSQLFDGCEVVVSRRLVNQRVAPCPMEVRGAAAAWGDDGRLTQWASTQMPHGVRDALASALGIEASAVRVRVPDVGGGFGAKAEPYPEELLLGWLARRVGRPVRWVETRSESMVGLAHGRGQVQRATIGGRRDGTIEAYRLQVVQDAGAYPVIGAVLPFMTRTMAPGVYRIPRVGCDAVSVVTNTTPVGAYRGAGRPEAAAAIERMVDVFAAEIGLDPAEVRRRNVVPHDAFPYTTPTGATYDSGDYERALDLALDAVGYAALREEQARRRSSGDQRLLGVGISLYVEITNPMTSGEYGSVEILPSGGARIRAGTSAHGQGHATAFAMLVSDATGIPVDDIELAPGDTDAVPTGSGTGGSRSLQTGGVAVRQAAVEVVEHARRLAAELLEASPDDVVLDVVGGRFHVAGTPAVGRTWAELAAAAAADEDDPGLAAAVDFAASGPTFPFGAHVAVVEVDAETGQARLIRFVAVDDAGRILNPLIAEGQIHGGLAQGVAQALFEEVRYDADGNPLTANLADYAFVSAAELPSFETVHLETPTPLNELGAKGIGESGSIGATPAVQNAVVDALAHLGVRHLDLPLTPERVWLAIAAAQSGERS